VLAAGFWLPGVADGLAAQLGWNRSFAGTLLMALLTTLPELAVTLAALRLGQLDMAVGNLLGSSLFNLVVIAVDDLAFRGGPLLAAVSPLHAVSAAVALMMTAMVMIGLILRPAGLLARRLSWIGIALIAAYLANALFMFLHGA
jgi:cation:H+ antiporter